MLSSSPQLPLSPGSSALYSFWNRIARAWDLSVAVLQALTPIDLSTLNPKDIAGWPGCIRSCLP